MNATITRKLKSAAAYALWGLAAAGLLAAVPYAALTQSGAVSANAGDDQAAIGVPVMLAEAERRRGHNNAFYVYLSWSAVDGAVRYDVERDRGEGYVSLGWIDAVMASEMLWTSSWQDPYYRVRACTDEDGADCGLWSRSTNAELRPLTAPTKVMGLLGARDHLLTVTLEWETDGSGRYHSNRGENMAYRVERDTGAGWETIAQVAIVRGEAPPRTYTDALPLYEPVSAQYQVSLCAPDVCGPAKGAIFSPRFGE